ncbi:MAG: hypothetical protein M1816_006285 [Peltula sp. TS41687]|nr:MAG: hypothetical protein M1816_006285 [Peltula sp. TS41687]
MASTDENTSVLDGPFIYLPPIPSSCFSPVATITGYSSLTSVVLPEQTECQPWAAFTVSSAYSTRGICPSGWDYDDAWNTDRDVATRTRICCPSGFTAAVDDITTTFTSSGTSTTEIGSSVFSTEFTAVLRTSWPSGTCYSTLSAPTVLQMAVSTGKPSESVTIADERLVSASYIRILSLSGADPSAAPAPTGSASSASSTSRASASSTSRASKSSAASHASSVVVTSRSSTSPTSRGSTSSNSGDPAVASLGLVSDTSTSPTASRTPSSGLSTPATVGIAVGITAVVMALLFGIFIVISRRRKRQKRLLQQPTTQMAPAPYPELETRPVENDQYMMLDSGPKFELAADHSWKAAEAQPGQPVAGYYGNGPVRY